jgi:hypothetical protein
MQEEILDSPSCWYEFQPHDYELSWDSWEIVLVAQRGEKSHYYNQRLQPRTRNACVLYSVAWTISDLTWYKFSLEELLEIVNIAEKEYWWREDFWMSLPRWVDCVRNWWNTKFPDNKLTSYRIYIGDEIYNKALSLWYTLSCSYLTSSWYYKDTEEIIYAGDILFPFSDVINRNAELLKPGYVEEWWGLELKEKDSNFADEIDFWNVSLEKAIDISNNYELPLHPNFIFCTSICTYKCTKICIQIKIVCNYNENSY